MPYFLAMARRVTVMMPIAWHGTSSQHSPAEVMRQRWSSSAPHALTHLLDALDGGGEAVADVLVHGRWAVVDLSCVLCVCAL